MVSAPKIKPPKVSASNEDIKQIRLDIAELRCHIVSLTESKKEMHQRITSLETPHPIALAESQYVDFATAMTAFADGKNVKRRFHQHYCNPMGCPNLAVNVDDINATDWMIQNGN